MIATVKLLFFPPFFLHLLTIMISPTYKEIAEQIKTSVAQHKNWKLEEFKTHLLPSVTTVDCLDTSKIECDLSRALLEAFKIIENPGRDKKLNKALKDFSSLVKVTLNYLFQSCISLNYLPRPNCLAQQSRVRCTAKMTMISPSRSRPLYIESWTKTYWSST